MERIAGSVDAEIDVERWLDGRREAARDVVADERPVQFRYRGIPHVVMLATPADLEDLAVGFTWTEGIATPAEIRAVEAVADGDALEVRIDVAPERFADLLQRQRHLAGRTGCGLCGAATLDDAIRPPERLPRTLHVPSAEVQRALEQLAARQPLNGRTGAVHAAAWVVPGQGIVAVREDVGRHNALDKLIGALVRSGEVVSRGYVLITSRASYEIVQKAASVGIEAVVAVSAPTGFAVRAARAAGLTLVGFARPGRHVVYAHAERLLPSPGD
jgi:formate dehydrogenase accessory protein FdhD